MSNNKQSIKLYTEEQLTRYLLDEGIMELSDLANNLIPHIEIPSDNVLMEHIDYLISCRQNLIDNADNMPQHLLEGGCMAFESAIDNARKLFLGGNK